MSAEENPNETNPPPPEKEQELSSDSDSYDEEPRINKKELARDADELFAHSGGRLSKEADSSDSDDNLEDSSSDEMNEHTRVEIKKDAFVVNDDGTEVYRKKTRYAVSANANLTLHTDQINIANKLFQAPIERPPVIKPKMPEIPDLKPVVQIAKDEFERECDRIPHDVDESKIADEARWIMDQHFKTRGGEERDIEALVEVLKELHNEKHTPQYIINYRKNIYRETVIGDEDIYHIQNAIREFKIFSDSRHKIEPLIERLGLASDPAEDDGKKALLRHFIRNADETALRDLKYYDELQLDPETTPKNASFQNNAGYFQNYIDKFLYSPMDFAYILSQNSPLSDPPEPQLDHQRALQNWYDELVMNHPNVFTSIDVMTRQMVTFAAKQLATHPLFIDILRTRLTPRIVINTLPSTALASTDVMYPKGKYGSIKRLKNKPIISFNKTDKWLLIEEARQSGCLSYTIDTDKGIDKEIEDISAKYKMRYPSDWDQLRNDILTKAIKEMIWPKIVAETEEELLKNAEKFVCNEIETRLFAHLTSPPYTALSNGTPQILKSQKILAMHFSSDDQKRLIYTVMVNEKGKIVDSIYLHAKLIDSRVQVDWDDPEHQISEKASELSVNDLEALKSKVNLVKFIERNKPSVIAITATGLRSAALLKAVAELVQLRIQPESARPKVILAPCEHANLYAYSNDCCEAELREIPKDKAQDAPMFLFAASTARRMQNPMAELCRLVTTEKNHLADWAMTPFQFRFNKGKDDKKTPVTQAIERACLRAIALTGVDMIAAASNINLRYTVQFIPGLGPHTADKILEIIQKESIKQRSKLRANLHEFDEMIIRNAMPFMRFPIEDKLADNHLPDDNNYLDGTLIPMDEYNTAIDVLKRGFFESQYIETNIIDLFSKTNKDFDISEPIKRFVAVSHSNNEPLIEFIANQLRIGPYETLRYPKVEWDAPPPNPKSPLERYQRDRLAINQDPDNYYRCMSDHEVFEALTATSTELIQENVITTVTILKSDITRNSMIIAEHTSSSIKAFCQQDAHRNLQELLSDCGVQNEKMLQGQVHDCVIMRVDENMVSIDVSFLPEHIEAAKNYRALIKDEDSFDFDGEDEARAEEIRAADNRIVTYAQRIIQHKNYKSITAAQAEAELASQEVGSFFFRPSSHGIDHISLTILFPNNVCANYDIVEKNKRNQEAVGEELYIRDKKFSDLEEIKMKFVKPMANKLNAIMKHPKWIEDPDAAEQVITEIKQQNPSLLVYRLTSSPKNKGYLDLQWEGTPGHIIHEPIRLFGDKIYYRDVEYSDIDQVFNFFKKLGYTRPPSTEPKKIPTQITDAEKQLARRNNNKDAVKSNMFGRK